MAKMLVTEVGTNWLKQWNLVLIVTLVANGNWSYIEMKVMAMM